MLDLSPEDELRLKAHLQPTPQQWYQLLGLLHEGVTMDELLSLRDYSCIEDLSYYASYREARRKEDRLWITDDTAVEEGQFACRDPECRSKRCYVETPQTRSADEGHTVKITCSICGSTYTFN